MENKKEDILEVSRKLELDLIDEKEFKKEIINILEINYKPKVTGKAKVINEKSIYFGLVLNIVKIYMIHNNNFYYKKGSREYVLSLEDDKLPKEITDRKNKQTVLHETCLDILELNEV